MEDKQRYSLYNYLFFISLIGGIIYTYYFNVLGDVEHTSTMYVFYVIFYFSIGKSLSFKKYNKVKANYIGAALLLLILFSLINIDDSTTPTEDLEAYRFAQMISKFILSWLILIDGALKMWIKMFSKKDL